jgi:hypothetical protein
MIFEGKIINWCAPLDAVEAVNHFIRVNTINANTNKRAR